MYLFPAPVGGGLGDIEEVLTIGRRLSADGHRIYFLAAPGRRLPRGVVGPLRWPSHRRVAAPVRSSSWAVAVSPSWGVCAAPERPGPLGRAGTWSTEVKAVESAYGSDRTLLLSVEEFARTLTSREQVAERYREGGVPLREIRRRFARGDLDVEVEAFHEDYRRFRGFSVPNLGHLYATFAPSFRFRREFPEAVQVGPIVFPRRPEPRRTLARTSHSWAVYTGPSNSGDLLNAVRQAVDEFAPGTELVLAPSLAVPRDRERPTDPRGGEPVDAWPARFGNAGVRIVSGSRTLLEALQVGGPFLYYNGTTGRDRGRRRHRPEKLQRLLQLFRAAGVPARLRRDLSDFARARNVREIVRRASRDPTWRAAFPAGIPTRRFPPGFERGEEVVARAVRALPTLGSAAVVQRLRSGESVGAASNATRRPRFAPIEGLS